MCNLSEAIVEDAMRDTMRDTIVRMLSKGVTSEEIADLTGYPLSLIEEVQADLEEVKP